jgi:hypothetical protein
MLDSLEQLLDQDRDLVLVGHRFSVDLLVLMSACIQLGIMSEITTMLATLLFQSEFRHQPATLLIQWWQHN